MRQSFSLIAGIAQDRNAGGHFIAADKVSGFVTVTTNTGRVYQLESGHVVYPDGGYRSISVESNTDQHVVLLCGYGRFEQVAEQVMAQVSGMISVQEILNPVQAEIINELVTRIAGTVGVTQSGDWTADVTGSQVEIANQITAAIAGNVGVTQAGAWSAEVTNTVQTRELLASGITEHTPETLAAAGDAAALPVNANRRDAVVIAPGTNTGTLTITGGHTLAPGERVTLERYTGTVNATADTAGDQVQFLEWVR